MEPPLSAMSPPLGPSRTQLAVQKSLQALQDAVALHSNLPQEHCAHILAEIEKLKETAQVADVTATRERELRIAAEASARQIQRDFDSKKKQDAEVVQGLKKELDAVREKFGSLTWERFKSDGAKAGKHINGLTGCRTVRVFESLFGILNIGGAFEQLRIRDVGLEHESNSVRHAARALSPKDFMLLTLMRLRMGLTEEDLAWLFGVSKSVVCRAFESCLLHMFHGFHLLFPPPSLAMREKTMPLQFKTRFGGRYRPGIQNHCSL